MGLDMYLSKKLSIKNWNFMTDPEKHTFTLSRGGKSLNLLGEPSYIIYEAAYWRKANAIHNWFVQNVQGGTDDCKAYYVCTSELEELRNICRAILDDPAQAEDLLPPVSGCFFGSTEYDKWYFDDLRYTCDTLTALLIDDERFRNDEIHFYYYYESSW